MIDLLVVLLNGILAGLGGCILLIFPVIYKIAEKSKKQLISFMSGFALTQYSIFILLGILTNALSTAFYVFKGIVEILVGLLLFYIFYESYFNHKEILTIKTKGSSKSFLYGISFGLATTSCSLGFIIASVGLSIKGIAFIALSDLLFTIGLVTPLTIFGLLINDIHKIFKFEKYIESLTNLLLLALSYYFVFIGFNQLRFDKIVTSNVFYILFIVWILTLAIIIVLGIEAIKYYKIHKKSKYKVRKTYVELTYLFLTLLLFLDHCFRRSSCLVCTLNDKVCMTEISIYVALTTIWLIARGIIGVYSKNQKKQ